MNVVRSPRILGCAVLTAVVVLPLLGKVRADTPPPVVDLWTWGSNNRGQLGSVPPNQTIPWPLHEARRWVAVSGGNSHTIALTDTGEVWAWGHNDSGQLGDGTTKDSILPVQVPGLSGITLIAAGGFHNLAYRASDGTLWAWGGNGMGQIGQPASVGASAVPVQIPSPGALQAIAAGGSHSALLTADGLVYAWGDNTQGQIGTGDFTSRVAPTLVPLPRAAVAIAAGGYHTTAALTSGGQVYAWGWNVFGQLGRGFDGTPTVGEPSPAPVLNVTDVVDVSAGDLHNLARTSDGHVWVWGYNTEGQLGTGPPDPHTDNKPTPVLLTTLDQVLRIDAGGIFSLALRTNGEVWAWGNGQFGACGDNARYDVRTPSQVLLPYPAVAISAAGRHAVALAPPRPSSRLVLAGAAGASAVLPKVRPAVRDAASLTDLVQVSSGWQHTLALDGQHRVWAFGDNGNGQLGIAGPGTDDPVPVDLPLDGAPGFVQVAARANQSFALRSDGAVFAWGDGTWGQLGIGTKSTNNLPTLVPLSTGALAVAPGERHTLVLDHDGAVWAWGQNLHGELGTTASPTLTLTPALVPGVVGPVLIAAGGYHSLAVNLVGGLTAWGSGFRGQLGSATLADSDEPVPVDLPRDVVAVSAGRFHTVVLRAGGTLSAFGDNSECQMGVSQVVETLTPTTVPGAAIAVQAGDYHSLFLDYAGGVHAWGNDAGGQLGRADSALSHADCDPARLPIEDATALGAGLVQSVIAAGPALPPGGDASSP